MVVEILDIIIGFLYIFKFIKLGKNNFNMRVIDFNHVLGKAAHCLHQKAAGFGRCYYPLEDHALSSKNTFKRIVVSGGYILKLTWRGIYPG